MLCRFDPGSGYRKRVRVRVRASTLISFSSRLTLKLKLRPKFFLPDQFQILKKRSGKKFGGYENSSEVHKQSESESESDSYSYSKLIVAPDNCTPPRGALLIHALTTPFKAETRRTHKLRALALCELQLCLCLKFDLLLKRIN